MLHKSIYYNSEGNLVNSSPTTTIQYILAAFAFWSFSVIIVVMIFSFIKNEAVKFFLDTAFIVISFVAIGGYLYQWGWNSYHEAWYYFDHKNQMFTVIENGKFGWETIEVPYEQIEAIEWSGGSNGRAVIHAAGFKFYTSRAQEKRFSSVTEMWSDLAKTESRMTNWPIYLECKKCNRSFGHHIGTATCPFDQLILIDTKVKGRIDPMGQHPEDLDRL